VKPEDTTVAKQQLRIRVASASNTRTTIEKLLDSVFSLWSFHIKSSVSSERKVVSSSKNLLSLVNCSVRNAENIKWKTWAEEVAWET
jgi:hypothetical protein